MGYGDQYTDYQQNYVGYGGYSSPTVQPQRPDQWPRQAAQPPQQAMPQNVNKIYVTSLEDALARFANTNTITVYHLQDETGEIEVATDGFGKKSYKIRKLIDYTPEEPKKEVPAKYATKEYVAKLEGQIKSFESRFKEIESKLNPEVNDNE